ncbi:cytochrome-c peroxidase [Idiomarina xiamenensis]|uniref:Cytochrome-c peroxidase n=1 Tax=Idiomarina xiamenensis 10-D-4 TaxID=740709 RepID=K2JZ26_9GAMM|nr:cytochrome c peroxidase [Idiomarina xiamenensis]EKE80643.1 cytochrome-c peroxidase [Idiomarina xiamenensis 10-D-4]
MLAKLLLITTTTLLSEVGPSSAETDATALLWEHYLRPQIMWPALPDDAIADLAMLPAVPAVDTDVLALGTRLFHDPQLSSTGDVSCASCHQAAHAFADPQEVSSGSQGAMGKRNAPALVNTRLWRHFFWDGRSPDLVHQAAIPLADPVEMANSTDAVVNYVGNAESYRQLWRSAYADQAVEWRLIAAAIAEFEQQLQSPPNRLDQFLLAIKQQQWQQAKASLTDQELMGLDIFRGKAGCIKCHNGPLLSDQQFHNTGLHYYGRFYEDLGRFEVTANAHDMGKFRTPSLRQLRDTAPYMHNGLFPHLGGIVNMYSHGGARPQPREPLPTPIYYPQTSDLLVPFRLSEEERRALLAFLQML